MIDWETGGRASLAVDMLLLIAISISYYVCPTPAVSGPESIAIELLRSGRVVHGADHGLIIGIGVRRKAEHYLANDMAIQGGSQVGLMVHRHCVIKLTYRRTADEPS